MKTITFGICVKDSQETIKRALDSIISQDYPTECMDIIVVDGGSRDGTLKIVQDIMSTSTIRSRILLDNGKGLGAARQIVLDQTCSDYLVYVGSDAIFPKDYVRRQIDFMESHPCFSAVNPEVVFCPQKSLFANVQNLLFSVSPNASNGTTFRTSVLKRLNGFDTRIRGASEDRDLMFRLKKANFKLGKNPEAKLYHGREETLREIFKRYSWYGFGDHFIHHKYRYANDLPYYLPPPYVAWGLKLSPKTYAKYHTKKSFLIPLLCVFASISWCIGFLKAHKCGYGHSINTYEISLR